MGDAPFRYYLRVRYHECDAQRVVFNGHYGTYVDMAVTEFFNRLLPDRHDRNKDDPGQPQFEFQLVRQLVEWKAPARFGDVIEIATWCEKIGNTSFVMRFDLRKPSIDPGEGTPFVTAETVNVVMDGRTWTKLAIPPYLREKLMRGAPGEIADHAGYLPRANAVG